MRGEAAGFESAKDSAHERAWDPEPHVGTESAKASAHERASGPYVWIGVIGLGGHGAAPALAHELTELQSHVEAEGLESSCCTQGDETG